MKTKTTRRRLRRHARSFVECLREFLTPILWKQAHFQRHSERRSSRWSTQPLVLVLLLMTWCCGDSQPERFETAKAFCIACLPKRRRPGRTVQGFQKALARLPMGVLRAITAGIRQTLASRLASRWFDDGLTMTATRPRRPPVEWGRIFLKERPHERDPVFSPKD